MHWAKIIYVRYVIIYASSKLDYTKIHEKYMFKNTLYIHEHENTYTIENCSNTRIHDTRKFGMH